MNRVKCYIIAATVCISAATAATIFHLYSQHRHNGLIYDQSNKANDADRDVYRSGCEQSLQKLVTYATTDQVSDRGVKVRLVMPALANMIPATSVSEHDLHILIESLDNLDPPESKKISWELYFQSKYSLKILIQKYALGHFASSQEEIVSKIILSILHGTDDRSKTDVVSAIAATPLIFDAKWQTELINLAERAGIGQSPISSRMARLQLKKFTRLTGLLVSWKNTDGK